jgi:hypothetical protein
MTTVRELKDAILAIQKRNSPPLHTLGKAELATLLAKLQGKTAETPAKKVETLAPAPKVPGKNATKIAEFRESMKKKKMEAKSAPSAPAEKSMTPVAAPKKTEAESNYRKSVLHRPYIYTKFSPVPWLTFGKQLLLSAKEDSEKHPPKPRTHEQMQETFGFVDVPLDTIPILLNQINAGRDLGIYLGGRYGNSRTDVWNNDTKLEWDWEKKGKLYYPEKIVSGRIGFRWLYPTDKYSEEHDEDFEDAEFEQIIRLTFEVHDSGKITFMTHARTEYERSDDAVVDAVVEKALKGMK